MKKMKIYTFDCGWKGALVCVASTKEEAYEKFKNTEAYCWNDNIYDISNVYEYDLTEVVEVGGDY